MDEADPEEGGSEDEDDADAMKEDGAKEDSGPKSGGLHRLFSMVMAGLVSVGAFKFEL